MFCGEEQPINFGWGFSLGTDSKKGDCPVHDDRWTWPTNGTGYANTVHHKEHYIGDELFICGGPSRSFTWEKIEVFGVKKLQNRPKLIV